MNPVAVILGYIVVFGPALLVVALAVLYVHDAFCRTHLSESVIEPGSWVTDPDTDNGVADELLAPVWAPEPPPLTRRASFQVAPGQLVFSPINQRWELVTFTGTVAHYDNALSQWVTR